MTWIARLLLACGLWLAMVSSAEALAKQAHESVRALVTGAIQDEPRLQLATCEAFARSDSIDKAKGDERALERLAIGPDLAESVGIGEVFLEEGDYHPVSLPSKATRSLPNARAPPVRSTASSFSS